MLKLKSRSEPKAPKTPVQHLTDGLERAFEEATRNGETMRAMAIRNQCRGAEMGIMAMHEQAERVENARHNTAKTLLAQGAAELRQSITAVMARCDEEYMPAADEFAKKFAASMPAERTEQPPQPVRMVKDEQGEDITELAEELKTVIPDAAKPEPKRAAS